MTKESGLQPAPEFLVKCIQLYEMTVVRHGMMLVGPTGGGKSRILRTLQAAMSRVKDDPAFERGVRATEVPAATPRRSR